MIKDRDDRTGPDIDPDGINPHAAGAKLDKGKLLAGILFQFSRALIAVLQVCTFGANKYSRGGWQHVKNGHERYTDAMMRHLLAEANEPFDPESNMPHSWHVAWNALARLEFELRNEGIK